MLTHVTGPFFLSSIKLSENSILFICKPPLFFFMDIRFHRGLYYCDSHYVQKRVLSLNRLRMGSNMASGDMIKHAREAKQWLQKQLAEKIGVTPGFITKLETGQSRPSYERCVALAEALDLPLDELWEQVQEEKVETSGERIRTRGAAIRGVVRTRGAPARPPEPAFWSEAIQDIAREIARDTDLRACYDDLKAAFASPKTRETVRQVLRALAREADGS
jgi:transcriptional regulator with XRE-family HTH domain